MRIKSVTIGLFALVAIIGAAAVAKKKLHEGILAPKEEIATVAVAPDPIVEEQFALPPPEATYVHTLPFKGEENDFPEVDRVWQLFTTGPRKLPIVETVSYTSRVDWLEGRQAWIADYASHYNTSRHFIARSLNRNLDYFTQKVGVGSKFNVFKPGKNIQFYLLVDVSRCKLGFYYLDVDTNERVLLKTYPVALGKVDETSPSGSLTPLGRYSLGENAAIYKPGVLGLYHDKEIEMINIFGTRWIPFSREIDGKGEEIEGVGLHGVPWKLDESGVLYEENETLGHYVSNGCIRLATEAIEEIFAIVLTKPTFVEVVKDFSEAKLPGVEK